MRVRELINSVLSLVALAATFAVTVATSSSRNVGEGAPTQTQTYEATSNCPHAEGKSTLTVRNGFAKSPSERSFRELGFPQDMVYVGEDLIVIGKVDGVERTCAHETVAIDPRKIDRYRCFEDSKEICQITLTTLSISSDANATQ